MASGNKVVRVYSCITCQHRKVKCDKKQPCSVCVKAGVQCTPSIPAPPRRRKKENSETRTLAKPKRYEDGTWSEGTHNGMPAGPKQPSLLSERTKEDPRAGKEPATVVLGQGMTRFVDK